MDIHGSESHTSYYSQLKTDSSTNPTKIIMESNLDHQFWVKLHHINNPAREPCLSFQAQACWLHVFGSEKKKNYYNEGGIALNRCMEVF